MRIMARTPAVMWRSDAFRSIISCRSVRRLNCGGGPAGAAGGVGAAAGAGIFARGGLVETLELSKHHDRRAHDNPELSGGFSDHLFHVRVALEDLEPRVHAK